jgi:hypothetical protein
VLHVLLYVALCCLPALILIPLRILDREPSNEIVHEQEPRDEEGRRTKAGLAA